jgi:hypothetical protein
VGILCSGLILAAVVLDSVIDLPLEALHLPIETAVKLPEPLSATRLLIAS